MTKHLEKCFNDKGGENHQSIAKKYETKKGLKKLRKLKRDNQYRRMRQAQPTMTMTTMTYNTARLRNLRGILLSMCQTGALNLLNDGISACVEHRRSAQRNGWALLNNDALSIIDVDARVLDGTAKANAYVGVEGGFSEPSRSWSQSRMRRRKQGKQQT